MIRKRWETSKCALQLSWLTAFSRQSSGPGASRRNLGKLSWRERAHLAKGPSSSQYSNGWCRCMCEEITTPKNEREEHLAFIQDRELCLLLKAKLSSLSSVWVKTRCRLNISLTPFNKSSNMKALNWFQVTKLCFRPKLKKIYRQRKKYEACNRAKFTMFIIHLKIIRHAWQKSRKTWSILSQKNQSTENTPELT